MSDEQSIDKEIQAEEQKAMQKYGHMPKKSEMMNKRLHQGKARFDSADWAMGGGGKPVPKAGAPPGEQPAQ